MRILLAGAGSLITLAGVIFTLQGVGVIGGSFMSGTTTWAVTGPIIALAGLALIALALRPRRLTFAPLLSPVTKPFSSPLPNCRVIPLARSMRSRHTPEDRPSALGVGPVASRGMP